MVDVIEAKKASVASFEKNASTAGIKLSAGYLRKAAKNRINIGVDILEYFLGEFPDVEAEWLISGKGNQYKAKEKHTAATKMSEAAVLVALEGFRDQINFLSAENSKLSLRNEKLTKALLERKMIKEGE